MKTLRSQIQINCGMTQILIGLVLVMLILGKSALAEALRLSEARDMSDLGMTEVYVREPQDPDDLDNIQRWQSFEPNTISIKTLTCTIDPAKCALFQESDGYNELAIENLPYFTNPGQPQLPMKTLAVELPKNAEVLGIEVVSGSYSRILNSVNFATRPQPRIWMRQEDIPEELKRRLEKVSTDFTTKQLDTYFPGEIATYSTGRDNNSTYVHVRVFPVQCIPKSNEAILITNMKIKVCYAMPTSEAKAFTRPGPVDMAESVIICPAVLKPAAELLGNFHSEQENVLTSIVTTEEIDATYEPANDPLFLGYSIDCAGKDEIVGYNYPLAKKIISYLRNHESHPNLKYVTLLGDGQLIPPSYYINEYAAYDWYRRASYYDWIPTDFLYTSPDYDFVANYRVGRLPVSDVNQAISVVRKIERWHNSISWDWFKRASVAGGRPFGTMWYYGELGTVDLINRDIFNGMELAKYYHSDGTFDVAHVKPLFTTEDTGLFYHIDHGSGYRLWVGEDSIGVSDLMIPSIPQLTLFNPETPIVVSVSCINGAYDTDLTRFYDQPEFPTIPSPTSFGESTVLSDAGGIAYIGGSRLNYAGWSDAYDRGRLVANHFYMGQICAAVLESYHHGANRIGDMTYDALRYFARDNSMESWVNRETLFGFVLLGDPVLSVPIKQSGPSSRKPHLAAVDPDRISGEGIPRYEDLPADLSKSINIVSDNDSPTNEVKSVYVWNDIPVGVNCLSIPSPTHSFTPGGCGYYLVRSVAADGKESWLYLDAQFEFNRVSNVLFVDGDYGIDCERFYIESLNRLGRTCDIWEAGARDPIDAEILAQYLDGTVIWAIPFGYPTEMEKAACRAYLDRGGSLFITGQDIGFYLQWYDPIGLFYQDYLHALYVQDDSRISTLRGIPRDPVGGGLTITINGGSGADNQLWPDVIEAVFPAVPVFTYETGSVGALRVDTGTYKLVYFGFGFEGINSQTDRDNVMKRVMDWLL